MKALAALFLSLAAWLSPQTVCGVRIDPAWPAPVVRYALPFEATHTWRGLTDRDLLARTILSEQGAQVLHPEYQIDSVGVAWVVLNRTRGISPAFDYGRRNLYAVVVSPMQFSGMEQFGNGARAADPERFWKWYGSTRAAGRLAYWTAYAIAQCVLRGDVHDPTRSALFFASAYYKASGEVAPYPDGHTRFRRYWSERSWRIDGISVNWSTVIERAAPPSGCFGKARC